ncbi:hypothetical protein REPUB_Repub20aG0123500 [Reevesia pubescens]
MYGKCNEVDLARWVFDSMEDKNVVCWTSMITAYAQNGRGHEGLEVFREFNWLGWEHPNQFMLASVINACASLGKLVSGKVTHGAVIRRGHDSNDVVASALVDILTGLVDEGLEYLNSMSRKHGIAPDAKHYTCVVDMLGRTGRLDGAYQLAKSIKVNNDKGALLWRTLLSASRLHGRVEIAVETSKKVETNRIRSTSSSEKSHKNKPEERRKVRRKA